MIGSHEKLDDISLTSSTTHSTTEENFSEVIEKMIEAKFNFSPESTVLEKKPKADKGV